MSEFERQIYNFLLAGGTLVAGKKLRATRHALTAFPAYQRVQILSKDEITKRRDLRFRLPRQLQQMSQLFDVMLNIKDTADLRFSLDAHFRRLQHLYGQLLQSEPPEHDEPESKA